MRSRSAGCRERARIVRATDVSTTHRPDPAKATNPAGVKIIVARMLPEMEKLIAMVKP